MIKQILVSDLIFIVTIFCVNQVSLVHMITIVIKLSLSRVLTLLHFHNWKETQIFFTRGTLLVFFFALQSLHSSS